MDRHGTTRQRDLCPVRVYLTPKRSTPRVVERLQGAVLASQPLLKRSSAVGAVATTPVARKLVVDLPCSNGGMISVVIGHCRDNTTSILAVDGHRGAVVTTPPESNAYPILVYRKHLRMGLDKPGRGRSRRRSEDHPNSAMCKHFDGFVQPSEVKVAFARFYESPRKLREANHLDTSPRHQIRVDGPSLARPLLRIIVYTYYHRAALPS